MPNNLIKQFNQRAIGLVENPPLPAGSSTSVAVALSSEQRKTLTGIEASTVVYNGTNYLVAQTRLIVCTGTVAYDVDGNAIPDPLPSSFAGTIPQGAERVILDIVFQNRLSVQFDNPITVGPGEDLNVIIGRSHATGEAVGVTPALCMLTALGWMGDDKDSKFPYELR